MKTPLLPEIVENQIYWIRGYKVMLSTHLAELYEVEPRVLIQAVKRNIERFPEDFMFQLNKQEFENLKSQIVISTWGGMRTAPYAFTEQGVAMLSSVLNHPPAPLKGGVKKSPLSSIERGAGKIVCADALYETGVYRYSTELLEQARLMRQKPTKAEKTLWDEVLRSRKTGFKFTRQKPLENFILDFYCSELLLGIEADGEIHLKQEEKDQSRDERLNQLGIKVLRLTNRQVLENTKNTQESISQVIEQRYAELYSDDHKPLSTHLLRGNRKTIKAPPFKEAGEVK